MIIKQSKSELCNSAFAKCEQSGQFYEVERDCKLLSAGWESDGSGNERVL